ncbi:hypothetical protein TPHV1_10124 [Treponema phagedenis]|uniref:Uncharacterized protein n=1 Tax=Treponema phagedenis TaxID=162 RepID=A0A0B7GUW1_TREPH|nr:hypothetical protein TPHV1_10124 [Treponema phagedenis]
MLNLFSNKGTSITATEQSYLYCRISSNIIGFYALSRADMETPCKEMLHADCPRKCIGK